ncbi:putative monooxygenase p33MONOX isoform X2 [Gouania willdenowi]|nr:putative monooxygenase p33MONOX isoform X2 [Gouania willdenowi]
MKLPVGMTRRALSYDDNLEAPMSTPPHDISINLLWKRPLIPERRHTQEEQSVSQHSRPSGQESSASFRAPPIVKAKASSIIMNSLITRQTQDSMYTFEQRAGLTDSSYTPHKGLTAEETQLHHRLPHNLQKMQVQSSEVREEHQSGSAQSTPTNTPHSSPKQQRRAWLSSQSSDLSVEPGGGSIEKWSLFGPRPLVHKTSSEPSTTVLPAGFALQTYRGAHKPTPTELMKSQGSRPYDDSAPQIVAPPTMDIPALDGRRPAARPHKLKHRDMNVLTPSGF